MNYHRPVVVATPKSMLRSKAAASLPEEFTSGAWHPVLDDPTITDPSEVTRLLICSGKIRWELVTNREKFGLDGKVAIISLERLYPLPGAEMAKVLERYRHVTDIRFVQDEPANQGPWPFISVHLPNSVANHTDLPLRMHRVARPWSSAPSVGSMKVHSSRPRHRDEQRLRGVRTMFPVAGTSPPPGKPPPNQQDPGLEEDGEPWTSLRN